MAWKITKNTAAQIASAVPTPAHAVIKPRFAMVEYARTRLPFDWEIAMNEQRRKVMPPTKITRIEGANETA